MQDFRNKVAVITGGSSGIGFALAKTAIAEGMKVAISGTDAMKLENAASQLRELSHDVLSLVANIADEPAMDHFAAAVHDKFGIVNLLCCNAGVNCLRPIVDMTLDDWNWVVTTNLGGTFNTLRAFLPRMLAQSGEKHVLYTGSMSSVYAPKVPGLSAYTASKMGILGLSAMLDQEVPSDFKQTFAFVGSTESDMSTSALRRRPGRSKVPPSDKSRGVNRIPADAASRMMFDGIKADQRYMATHPEQLGWVEGYQKQLSDAFRRENAGAHQ